MKILWLLLKNSNQLKIRRAKLNNERWNSFEDLFLFLFFYLKPLDSLFTRVYNYRRNNERLKSMLYTFFLLILSPLAGLPTFFTYFLPAHPKMINFFRKLSRETTNEQSKRTEETFCQRHTRFFSLFLCVLFSLSTDFRCCMADGRDGENLWTLFVFLPRPGLVLTRKFQTKHTHRSQQTKDWEFIGSPNNITTHPTIRL